MKILLITTIIFSSLFFSVTTNTKPSSNLKIIITENSGKDVFNEVCASCHTGGFKGWITGAPDIDDVEDWEKHLDKGLAKLTKNVFEGTSEHKEKGGCDDCTKEQIKAAIEYIISKIKK